MIAAIVAPAGVRSIARMRACLVSGRVEIFGDECADRERGLDLLVVRLAERIEALDFDLGFVMGSSEVMRRHPSHYLSPARAKPRQGKTPKCAFATASHHSNAPIKPISQPILSKIVALLTAPWPPYGRFELHSAAQVACFFRQPQPGSTPERSAPCAWGLALAAHEFTGRSPAQIGRAKNGVFVRWMPGSRAAP